MGKNSYPGFVVRRLLQAVLVIVLTYVFTFVVISVLPGDPVANSLDNPENGFTEEEKTQIIAFYGLDKPILVQLGASLWRFVQGDFGISLRNNVSITATLTEAIPSTLALAGLAFGVAAVLAFLIGYGVLYLPEKFGGKLLRSFPPLFLSVPNFLIGLLLIEFFAFELGLFKITDPDGPTATWFAAIALGLPVSAQITQVLITSLDNVRSQGYIDVAVSRGLEPTQVFFRHLLKPSALPVFTVAALAVGELLGGSLITETVFGRNGVGTVVQKAVVSQDLPVLQATVVLAALVFVLINLLTDLVYPLLDPRLSDRFAKQGVPA